MIKMKYKKPSYAELVDSIIMIAGLYLVYTETNNGLLTFGVFLIAISTKFSLGAIALNISIKKKDDERS